MAYLASSTMASSIKKRGLRKGVPQRESLVLHYIGYNVHWNVDIPAVRATPLDSAVFATASDLYCRLAYCFPWTEGGDGQRSPPKHRVNHNEASLNSGSSHLRISASIFVCSAVLCSWFIRRCPTTLAAIHSGNEGVDSPSVFHHLVARFIHAFVFTRLHQPILLKLPEL